MKKKNLSNSEVRSVVAQIRESANDPHDFSRRTVQTFESLVDDYGVGVTNLSILNLFEVLCDPNGEVNRQDATAVSEAIVDSAFPTIFTKLVHKNVWDKYGFAVGDIFKLVTEIDGANVRENKIPAFTDLAAFEEVKGSDTYPEDVVDERYATIDLHKTGKIISVSLEMLMGDQTGVMASKAQNVGKMFGETLAKFATEKIFGLACTLTGEGATGNCTIDGSAVTQFSDDHSAVDGQTCDNVDTGAFSTANITVLRTLLRKMVDARGQKITVNPMNLIVPPELWQKAFQLTQSAGAYDTANRAENPYKGLTLYELVHLTSATHYFLGDPASQTWWLWGWRPRLEAQGRSSNEAFERDIVARSKFSARFGCGLVDYRFLGRSGT